MVKLLRGIKRDVERILWAKAAGRCQFDGHNRLLYKSAVTNESLNLAEMAHIYAFSEAGPRGHGKLKAKPKKLNGINNLLLVCDSCHKKIDRNPGKYTAKLLKSWKEKHESRVRNVTGISPEKKRHVILYGANIGSENSPVNYDEAVSAMFPEAYPADDKPILLSTNSYNRDDGRSFWLAEAESLRNGFQTLLFPLTKDAENARFSIFALAPQPLLILLGSLLTDKISVETYQLQREPKTWKWQDSPKNFHFTVNRPDKTNGPPVLILSLSDNISKRRIHAPLGRKVTIWEVTIEKPQNDFLKSKVQLSEFRRCLRSLMVEIKKMHGQNALLSIFPAIPVSCAVELGRIRMPKADMPWMVYDHNNKLGGFQPALSIPEDDNE